MQYLVVKTDDTGQNPIFKNIFEDKRYIKEEEQTIINVLWCFWYFILSLATLVIMYLILAVML